MEAQRRVFYPDLDIKKDPLEEVMPKPSPKRYMRWGYLMQDMRPFRQSFWVRNSVQFSISSFTSKQ